MPMALNTKESSTWGLPLMLVCSGAGISLSSHDPGKKTRAPGTVTGPACVRGSPGVL